MLFGDDVVVMMSSGSASFVVGICGTAEVLSGTSVEYAPSEVTVGTTAGSNMEVVVLSSISGGIVSGKSLSVPVLVVVFVLVAVVLVLVLLRLSGMISGVSDRMVRSS